jgi:hypothetical protein
MRPMTIISALVLSAVTLGCRSRPDWVTLPTDAPVVSCTNLVKRWGTVYQKNSGKPFTGTTWIYYGLGSVDEQAYYDGRPVYSSGIHMETSSETMFPTNAACQDAVREFIAREGPSHDSYFFLAEFGNASDIPVLLRALKRFGDTSGAMTCSKVHCLEALQRITGAYPGENYSDWVRWRRDARSTQPP